MSPRTRPASPEDVRKIVAHAQEHKACRDCGAAPGGPCTQPGRGRTVCKSRYIAAAIAIRRQTKAEQRSPEREAEIAWPRHPSRYRAPRGPRHHHGEDHAMSAAATALEVNAQESTRLVRLCRP